MTAPDEFHLPDVHSAVDVGQGYMLTWCVGPDGTSWPLLMDTRQTQAQYVPWSRAAFAELAPHELTGRLPVRFEQFFCGARTHSGKPCKARVAGPGLRCRHHREATVAGIEAPGDRSPSAPVGQSEPPLFDLDPGCDS